jgi:serine protease Do
VGQAIEISRQLWRRQAGEQVSFTLGDGKVVSVTLERIPELSGEEMARQKLHLELQELTPRLAAALRLPYARGLVVSGMDKGSALEKRGLQRGDVIIQIGEVPVANFTDLYRALNMVHHGDVVEVIIHRLQYNQGMVMMRRYSLEVPF